MDRSEQSKHSYHILIYGSYIDEDIKCIEPFEEYYAPMYGYYQKGLKFIGLEFDRINRLYQNYTHANNILTISNSSPSINIINLWNETYPKMEGKIYCLIQNVYTSHYANGSVMYGYWIKSSNDDINDLLYRHQYDDVNGMEIFTVGHTQSSNVPKDFFYGILLAHLPENEDEDACEELASKFMDIYKSQNIPSRSQCILDICDDLKIDDPKMINFSDKPEITVICNMCYCCT